MVSGKDDIALTTTQVGQLMGKTGQTIRNWTEEFAQHFSPLATVEGRQRVYNKDDLSVLTLVQEMRDAGFRPQEISEALARGERSEIPDLDIKTLVSISVDLDVKRLEVELDTTRRELAQVRQQLDEALTALQDSQAIREQNIRLEAKLEILSQQYEAQLEAMRHQLEITKSMYEGQMGQSASTYLDLLEKRQQEIREKDHQIIELLRELGDHRERFGKYSARDEDKQEK